jgi:hypothetical protein
MSTFIGAVPSQLLSLGPVAVGATFLWAGAIKAISPYSFQRHLLALGWIPANLVIAAVTTIAAFETSWGVALIVALSQRLILPLSVLLLACLSTISWWGVKTGKAADCGCYGGYIRPSIGQSLGINAAFAVLLLLAWTGAQQDIRVETWQLAAVIMAMVTFGGLAVLTQRHERLKGEPLFDTNPIKVGSRWSDTWAAGKTAGLEGEIFVSLLGPECPFCKQWVRVGNAMTQSQDLPPVIGIIAASREKAESFIRDYEIRFPVGVISDSLMARFTRAVPTTIHIVSGTIEDIWVGALPPEFVVRFTRAFFPDASIAVPDKANAETLKPVAT